MYGSKLFALARPFIMNQVTHIFLVRHGEAEHNAKKLMGGHTNFQLTEKGRRQAHEAKKKVADLKFDVVYSSPLDRAVHTVEIVGGRTVPEENKLPELRERNFGSWEGKPDQLLEAGIQYKLKAPRSEAWHHKYIDDMESDHELAERYTDALINLANKYPGQSILVGSHGGAIRVTIMKHSDNPRFTVPGSINNGDIVELVYDGKELRVVSLNGEPV